GIHVGELHGRGAIVLRLDRHDLHAARVVHTHEAATRALDAVALGDVGLDVVHELARHPVVMGVDDRAAQAGVQAPAGWCLAEGHAPPYPRRGRGATIDSRSRRSARNRSFASMPWTPLCPSTDCVMRKVTATLHRE